MSELKDKIVTLESLKITNDTLNEKIDAIDGVVVSDDEPSGNTALWVKLSTGESFKIPEIDDANTNTEDTWSSQKIQNEISKCIPSATSNDNGKFLSVADGVPTWVEIINGNEVSY